MAKKVHVVHAFVKHDEQATNVVAGAISLTREVQEFWLPNDTFHPVYPLETNVTVDHNATDLPELRRQNELYKQTIEDLVRNLNRSLGKPERAPSRGRGVTRNPL